MTNNEYEKEYQTWKAEVIKHQTHELSDDRYRMEFEYEKAMLKKEEEKNSS